MTWALDSEQVFKKAARRHRTAVLENELTSLAKQTIVESGWRISDFSILIRGDRAYIESSSTICQVRINSRRVGPDGGGNERDYVKECYNK